MQWVVKAKKASIGKMVALADAAVSSLQADGGVLGPEDYAEFKAVMEGAGPAVQLMSGETDPKGLFHVPSQEIVEQGTLNDAINILTKHGIGIENVNVDMNPNDLIKATVLMNFFDKEEGIYSGKLVGSFLSACGYKKAGVGWLCRS